MKSIILFLCFLTPLFASERIISTSPSITEMLGYFGEDKSVVGVSNFCQKPKGLCQKDKIGSMITMDMEKIISLRPSIVFTVKLSNNKNLQELKKLGINIIELSFNQLEDILESFRKMGKFLGKESLSKKFINDVSKELEAMPHFFRPESFAVVIGSELNHKKLASATVASERTYYGDIIAHRGHQNISPNNTSYPQMTLEMFLKKNPERIWVVSPKQNRGMEKAWNELVQITAIKNKNLHFLYGDWAVVPGPSILILIKKMRESF